MCNARVLLLGKQPSHTVLVDGLGLGCACSVGGLLAGLFEQTDLVLGSDLRRNGQLVLRLAKHARIWLVRVEGVRWLAVFLAVGRARAALFLEGSLHLVDGGLFCRL